MTGAGDPAGGAAPPGAVRKSQHPEPAEPQGRRVWRCLALAFAVGAFLLFPCGYVNQGDGNERLAQAKAFFFDHTLSIRPEFARDRNGQQLLGINAGRGGRLYSKYGFGLPLLWLLPMLVAQSAHALAGGDFDTIAQFAISFVNPAAVLLTVLSLRYALIRLGVGRARARAVIALYLLGCFTLPYANTAFGEPAIALLLLWAVLLPVLHPEGRWPAAASGALLAAISLIKTELALLPLCLAPLFVGAPARVGAPQAGSRLAAERWDFRSRMAPFIGCALFGWFVVALANLEAHGGIARFSYGAEAARFKLTLRGVRGYLFGIDRNLFIFNPALALALIGWFRAPDRPHWKRIRLVVALTWALFFPLYGTWWAWDGGWCFGPRFFGSFIPLTLLGAGFSLGLAKATPIEGGTRPRLSRTARFAASLVCAASLPIQFAGTVVKDNEAIFTGEITGQSQLYLQMRLAELKLARGIRSPEIFHVSDFKNLSPGSPDVVIDYRRRTTYQYLNQWWSLYLAARLRHTGGEEAQAHR